MDIIGTFLLTVFFVLFGAFWLFLISVVVMGIFAVQVRPGEIAATGHSGSRRVNRVYDRPGLYWRLPQADSRVTKLRVDEPVNLTLKPVEVRARENASVVVTVRLIMEVGNPVRYVVAVVGLELEEWKEEVLPGLIAAVVADYTFAQVLNDRGERSTVATALKNPLSGTRLNALQAHAAIA